MEQKNLNRLEQLKAETFEYLTHLHNNQIRGFYDWTGYWKKKEECEKELDKDRKYFLPELHEYMKSITVDDMVKAAHKEGREWIRKYGNDGRGRKSDNQKYAEKQAYCHKNSDFILTNWKILQRVRMFVGFYLGIVDNEEAFILIKETKHDELNSTFYTHPKSQISNAIFRLEILYSFLKGTSMEDECMKALKECARMMEDYLIREENKTFDPEGYKQAMHPIWEEVKKQTELLNSLKQQVKDVEQRINELNKQARDVNTQFNIGDFGKVAMYLYKA